MSLPSARMRKRVADIVYIVYCEERMDALASIANPDLPRDALISALLQLCTEDDLRGLRVKLFESAKENGLVHPKDILVSCAVYSSGSQMAFSHCKVIYT